MSYAQFKEQWSERHQASIPTEEEIASPYPRWARAAAFLAFLTSAMISGAHMVPAVYEGIPESTIVLNEFRIAVAYGSFMAYELGMFMAAFLMAVSATKHLAKWITGIIFVTLIIVNLYSVSTVYGVDWQNDIIGAGVSLSFSLVPVIAYASGKFYINIGVAERELGKEARERLKNANRELDAKINAEYTRYTKDYEKRLEQARERLETHTEYVPGTNEYDTDKVVRTEYIPSRAVRELADVLKQNTDDLGLSAAQIRLKYGKGQGVANDAKKLAISELE
jgi:hypothetical protein